MGCLQKVLKENEIEMFVLEPFYVEISSSWGWQLLTNWLF